MSTFKPSDVLSGAEKSLLDQLSSGLNHSANTIWNMDLDRVMRDKNIRYGMPYATLDDLIDYFDISRLPDYEGAPIPLVGHIIMVRPNLNIDVYNEQYDSVARQNYSAMCQNPMTATYATDMYGKKLLRMLSTCNTSPYMPIFTTKAINYSVNDMSLKTVEKAQTYFGHVIKYGKHAEDHKIGGTFSMDFRNDRYHSILKAVHLWASYIWNVSKNDSIVPSDTSQMNGIIDYGGSLFYLVTWMDMSTLVYWEKLTGVFPKTVPYSIFSYNDQPILEDKITVEFDYGVRSDPCDPDVLYDLNVLSSSSMSQATDYWSGGIMGTSAPKFNNRSQFSKYARPDSYERPFGLGNSFATRPIVQYVKQRDGSTAYKLQFIKP